MFFLLAKVLRTSSDEDRIPDYLSLALNIPREEIMSWPAVDALSAFDAVLSLNEPQTLHIDFAKVEQDKEPTYEYEGRNLASIVTTIASAFGWDKDYILDSLTYDEARCYLQEILLNNHREKEYLYTLSTIGYTYDSSGRGTQKAFPPPSIPPKIFAGPSQQRPEEAALREKFSKDFPGVSGMVIDLDQEQRG